VVFKQSQSRLRELTIGSLESLSSHSHLKCSLGATGFGDGDGIGEVSTVGMVLGEDDAGRGPGFLGFRGTTGAVVLLP
jgi:hypothetical protein